MKITTGFLIIVSIDKGGILYVFSHFAEKKYIRRNSIQKAND